MEGDEENRDNTCHFLGVSGASRDSMHKLVKRSRSPTINVEREREEKGELELSLGLSMNGRFGVDPESKKMRRSSSVSNMVLNVDCEGSGGGHQARGVELGGHAPLARTCSLPSDTHGWRRREEFDSEGGMRMEKLKNVGDGDGLHADGNGSFDAQIANDGSENWRLRQLPKASTESRGEQSHLVKGATQTTTMESGPVGGVPTVSVANTDTTDRAPVKNVVVDMPYVSTRGFGPNHNKIDGFLYRYRTGEEVKIVCVCHGMFLSPAEFVRHGGGGDVAYPLKHIVVNPFPLY